MVSRIADMQPSSPHFPCSALKATPGPMSARAEATRRSTSTSVTRNPARLSASAQAAPEARLTSRSADQPPGLAAARVLEGRTAGARLDRLCLFAPFGDLFHLACNLRRIALFALQQRLGEDQIFLRAAMPVGEAHVGIAEHVDIPLAID